MSRIKFPDVKKGIPTRKMTYIFTGSVVRVGFHGLNINGVPKFSVIISHHPSSLYFELLSYKIDVSWNNVLPYVLDTGRCVNFILKKTYCSDYRHKQMCEHCKRIFKENDLRVLVKVCVNIQINNKGSHWLREYNLEPLYKIFAFCDNLSCIDKGLKDLALVSRVPNFDKRIGVKSEIELASPLSKQATLERQGIILENFRKY